MWQMESEKPATDATKTVCITRHQSGYELPDATSTLDVLAADVAAVADAALLASSSPRS